MKSCKYKAGVTLIEMLIVVAVVALLASMVIAIATRIDNQGKERLTENTFAILTAALEQFGDYGYNYNQSSVYADFNFPLDCNDFNPAGLQTTLENALGLAAGSVSIDPVGSHDTDYSGSEVLHFFLSRVPQCRKTLDKIDSSLIISDGLIITIDGKKYPLLRIVDPWGITLRYDYYEEIPPPLTLADIDYMRNSERTFPVIISAGPDRIFGTVDDISSR